MSSESQFFLTEFDCLSAIYIDEGNEEHRQNMGNNLNLRVHYRRPMTETRYGSVNLLLGGQQFVGQVVSECRQGNTESSLHVK